MKRVKIDLMDLLMVLEAMNENGTKEILLFEHGGLPALADADDPDNMVTFQTFDPDLENKDGESVH
jgi:hypothetical protein